MIKAIYYPHTTIRSRNLLKTSLLLWDSVECIVPERQWTLEKPFKQKSYNEALELIVERRVPSDAERKVAHTEVSEFLKEGQSKWFLETALGGRQSGQYQMYPEKFLSLTWRELARHGLARWDEASRDYDVPPALGLVMMSTLADACAGTQLQKVTDRVNAYSLLEKARATLLGAPFFEGLDASQVAPELDRLVTLSLKVLDGRKISIGKLLAMRKRERKGSSSDYRTMRLNFLTCLQAYVNRVLTEAKSVRDISEIERQFREEMKDDLSALKAELNLASIEPLFSKEMALTVLAVAGAFVEPISGVTNLAMTLQGIGVVPLVQTAMRHRKQRRKALCDHKISWLYLTKERGLSVR